MVFCGSLFFLATGSAVRGEKVNRIWLSERVDGKMNRRTEDVCVLKKKSDGLKGAICYWSALCKLPAAILSITSVRLFLRAVPLHSDDVAQSIQQVC